MSEYRTKTKRIEAFQVGVTRPENRPSWFDGGFSKAKLHKTECPFVMAQGSVQVKTETGSQLARHGDWIIRFRNGGTFAVMSDSEFRDNYELVDRPPKIRSWKDTG